MMFSTQVRDDPKVSAKGMTRLVVMIRAGKRSGAVANGIREKDINLRLAKFCKVLEAWDKARLTRSRIYLR